MKAKQTPALYEVVFLCSTINIQFSKIRTDLHKNQEGDLVSKTQAKHIDREVIVVPCNGSFENVYNHNVYICPSRRNHTCTNYLAPYVHQKVDRAAKIKYRIRQVKFKNPLSTDYTGIDTSSSRFDDMNFNPDDQKKIESILNDDKIQRAITAWYRSERAWEGDRKLRDGIQIYILEEWEIREQPLRPLNVSARKFMGHRYATKEKLDTAESLDEACNLID